MSEKMALLFWEEMAVMVKTASVYLEILSEGVTPAKRGAHAPAKPFDKFRIGEILSRGACSKS